jgi:hypothetical protein
VLKIAGTDRVRVEFDATQIDYPGEPSRVIHHDLFRRSARRERQRDGSQPRRPHVRRTLLVKRLPFSAVDEPLQNNWTIPDSGHRAWRNLQVIAHEIEF